MIDHIRLSATSALVLIASGNSLYKTEAALEYWSHLDLSSGRDIYEECNTVWAGHDQVIKNRKWCIGNWCHNLLSSGIIEQVVIIAAGFSPLGIDLASLFPICNIFETDIINMPAKQEICNNIKATHSNIKFVEADAANITQCVERLKAAGWQNDRSTLLICEGISYYVSKSVARNIWKTFSNTPDSRCIFEYMIPSDMIRIERQYIPQLTFGKIMDYCNINIPMTTWSRKELKNESGINIYKHVTMHSIENERYKTATYFPTPDAGWIEIAELGTS